MQIRSWSSKKVVLSSKVNTKNSWNSREPITVSTHANCKMKSKRSGLDLTMIEWNMRRGVILRHALILNQEDGQGDIKEVNAGFCCYAQMQGMKHLSQKATISYQRMTQGDAPTVT